MNLEQLVRISNKIYVSGGSGISCTTKYGGVSKVFWFHKNQPTTCTIQGSALYLNGRTTCQITIEYDLNANTTNCTWYFLVANQYQELLQCQKDHIQLVLKQHHQRHLMH